VLRGERAAEEMDEENYASGATARA
jgi:hypothetical protein